MKKKLKIRTIRVVAISLVLGVIAPVLLGWGKGRDPLPSWNDGAIKQKIIQFAEGASNPKSRSFVKKEERVAVLDLDGTLLVEYPVNFQRSLALKRLKEMVREDMSLQYKQPYKAAWEDSDVYYNKPENHSFVFLEAFKGYSQHEYHAYVKDYLKRHKPEHWGKSFQELFYEPGLELVRYLEKKGFEVYVCSTTEEVCIRALLKDVLGMDSPRVMGNEVNMSIKFLQSGIYLIMGDSFSTPENREEGKCLYFNSTVGKQPIFVFGNSMGDYALMRYVASNSRPSMVMVLDHDDSGREIEYHDHEILKHSSSMGWNVVSMRNDFKRVFRDEK